MGIFRLDRRLRRGMTYVGKPLVCEGPADRPPAGRPLDEFRESIVVDLQHFSTQAFWSERGPYVAPAELFDDCAYGT